MADNTPAKKNRHLTKREQNEILRSHLELERSSFISHWGEITDFVNPRRARFQVTDVNKGDRRNDRIIDNTATLASRTLASGMMSGVTSPARPWFRLSTPSSTLNENTAVRQWLYLVGQIMATDFLKSNLYNVLPIIYSDMGDFGTAAMFFEEDFDDVYRFYPFAVGSYSISNNYRLKVDTFTRTFQMTVRQVVEKFLTDKETNEIDWTNASTKLKEQWENDHTEAWVEITHVVRPNENHNPKRFESKFKRYLSVYYERTARGDEKVGVKPGDGDVLSEKGYDYFPVLCPRWMINGEDAYGTNCPGMIALGDIKQLQLGEKRMMQAIEKQVNPPMVAPTSMRSVRSSIVPGDVTFVDEREGMKGFRPAHEVNPDLRGLSFKQQEVQQRIRRAYFEDLFLMLASSQRNDITAREIDERHEEKLLALGPVLEQLNQDLLDPLVNIAFQIGMRQRRYPEPPKELQGVDLKIEYVSVMSQSQKLVGIAGIERFARFAQGIIAVNPTSADKVDFDQSLDVYSEAVSVAPNIVRSDDAVNEIRAQRAKAQQAQMQMQQAQEASSAVKNLASADTSGDNALTRMIDAAKANALTEQL